MKAHLFLDSGVLKVTTETIPQRPYGLNYNAGIAQEDIDNFESRTEEYTSALSSIRGGATVVGNQPMSIQMWWTQETPNEGITRADWLKTKKEHEFYPIDCEVSYAEEVCEECGLAENEDCQNHPDGCEEVAILSPVVAQECKGQFRNDCPYPQCECSKKELMQAKCSGEPEQGQTVDANMAGYIALTNIRTMGFDRNWLQLWEQIEIWYGDIEKRETGIQLLERLKSLFTITRKPQ